jgi:hypothetical protein
MGAGEVDVRMAEGVIEIEPVQPIVRMRTRPGRLPVLEVEAVTDEDLRAGLEEQREEGNARWR